MAAGSVVRINVVYLYVSDLERSLSFYRDLLGIPLERHPSDEHWAEVRFADGVRFALHEGEPSTPNSIRVSLEVKAVEAAAERLRAAGVDVGAIEREPWGTLFQVVDPDGYEIGLFTPPGE